MAAPDSAGAAPSPPPPFGGGTLVLFTISMAMATFMEVLDLTIVNVAVPTIAGDLGVSANQGTWAISSYSVASAIAVPLTGWFARRIGESRLFTLSVSLFIVMSMLCGLATNLPTLAALRALQGLVSGPMVPLSQSLMLANYPPAKRGLALALWAMTIVVAPIFGPMIGGWISDNLSWPWIFYINVPIGVLSVFINWTLLKGRETPTVKLPIDVLGLVLLVVGVGTLQLMLDNGRDLDWFSSNLIVILAITATLCLSFLVAWELTEKYPIVDLTLFARRNFRVGASVLSLGYMTFFVSVVIMPLWMQTVMGYSATEAGLATAPVGVLSLILSPIVGRNIQRVDLRYLATVAFIVFAIVSFWTSTFTLDSSFAQIALPRLVQGIAIACFFVPLNQMLLSGLPPTRIAAAAGLSNFLRTLGGAIGTAVSVTVWDHRADYHHTVLVENVSVHNPAAVDYLGKAGQLGMSADQVNRFVDQSVTAQAIMLATNDVFWACGIIFIALLFVVWLTRPPFVTSGPGGH